VGRTVPGPEKERNRSRDSRSNRLEELGEGIPDRPEQGQLEEDYQSRSLNMITIADGVRFGLGIGGAALLVGIGLLILYMMLNSGMVSST